MVWLWIINLLACQEPFGTDRHDLEGFRIAAMTATADSDGVHPRAALVTDGHLWSHEPVTLEWHATDDPQQLAPDRLAELGAPVATGPAPVLSGDTTGIGVVATWPSGEQRAAWLAVVPDRVRVDGVRLSVVEGAEVSTITGSELALASRRTWTTTQADFVPIEGFARLVAIVDDPADPPQLRWMATGEQGTFFELDATSTDWAAGRLLVDDDEVEERRSSTAGVSTLLALAVGPTGAADWAVRELWLGEPDGGIETSSARWMATDATPEGRYLRGTLEASDSAPTGLVLTGVVEATPAIGKPDPWSTEGLPCQGVAGPFDPSWLVDGRCTRSDVVGSTVVVELP